QKRARRAFHHEPGIGEHKSTEVRLRHELSGRQAGAAPGCCLRAGGDVPIAVVDDATVVESNQATRGVRAPTGHSSRRIRSARGTKVESDQPTDVAIAIDRSCRVGIAYLVDIETDQSTDTIEAADRSCRIDIDGGPVIDTDQPADVGLSIDRAGG